MSEREIFYLKLTEYEANQMIYDGISVMFGANPRFKRYTSPIEDIETGDLYWCIENIKLDGVFYDICGYVKTNFPGLPRYTHDFVKQFLLTGE